MLLPLPLPPPHTRPPAGSKVTTLVCRVFLFHYPSRARRYPLNHLLNPRPSALSAPRSGLMAFENSNIIRRSIPVPVKHAAVPGESRDVEDFRDPPFAPLSKVSALSQTS